MTAIRLRSAAPSTTTSLSSFTSSTFTNNVAASTGGAIHSDSDLTVIDSTLDGNSAAQGGAIYNNILSTTIDRSLLSNNQALSGGGLYVNSSSDAALTNTTLSGNQAIDGDGGGVYAGLNTLVTMDFVTAVGNDAAVNGGAIYASPSSGGQFSLWASAFGNNISNGSPIACGELLSRGYNVVFANPAGCTLHPTDVIGDVLVAPLTDNGGPTLTHALQATSPAIDLLPADLAITEVEAFEPLRFNGNAATGTGGLDIISANGQTGSAFWSEPIDLAGQSFTTSFDFRITDLVAWSGYPSADGLTFTIADSPTALGVGGGSLGIGGLTNSVSVEFDTFDNNAAGVGCPCADPSHNHMGIDIGGDSLTSPLVRSTSAAQVSSTP